MHSNKKNFDSLYIKLDYKNQMNKFLFLIIWRKLHYPKIFLFILIYCCYEFILIIIKLLLYILFT